ncbi:MAG: dihydroorotate dehydrogenase electron transfer subunit [Candidatus Margulisbacteria bacterium]|nr:dihydroorotate dehydrogenase electron transfer subunit [Candidatus Margulisiibacteriota bacterium]
MPIQEKCRIQDHQKVGPRHFKLTLLSQYIASHAQPGQFVNVRCSDGSDPLLRRPISLHRINPEHGVFELLYEVVGKGTEMLTKYFVGEELDVLGPLGNGFSVDPKKKIHLMVGGGMGIAPLRALGESIKGGARYVFLGAKTKEALVCGEKCGEIADQIALATDDGTTGKKGLVSDILLDFIENQLTAYNLPLTAIYACGPRPMLKAIAEIAVQKKIDCQLSMEERMACGIGACKGCAIKTKDGFKMVCKDGPVFDAKEIVWN